MRDMQQKPTPKQYRIPFEIRFFVVNYLALLVLLMVLLASIVLGKFTLMQTMLLVPLNILGLITTGWYLLCHRKEVFQLEDITRKRLSRLARRLYRRLKG